MSQRSSVLTLLFAVLLPLQALTAGERWLHVRVAAGTDAGERVSVNVPLSVVASFLPLVSGERGELGLDLDEIDGVSLREVLGALRDAPDGVFVSVASADESVRVAKEDGLLLVHVDERRADGDKIEVRLPIAVAEALVRGDPDTLDIRAALDSLGEFDGEDLVRIESSEETVRIWIDSSPGGS